MAFNLDKEGMLEFQGVMNLFSIDSLSPPPFPFATKDINALFVLVSHLHTFI